MGEPGFPNLHSDTQEIHKVSEWTTEHLDYKTHEYGDFLQREDIMPRALHTANRILDHLLFEQAYRDGVYES